MGDGKCVGAEKGCPYGCRSRCCFPSRQRRSRPRIWLSGVPPIRHLLKAEGIAFGVIYDGGGTAKQESDELWTQEAVQRFRAVESSPATIPDQAVLQT